MIRILWIVNIPLPEVCKQKHIKGIYGGGWLVGILSELSRNSQMEISIAAPYECLELEEIKKENIRYLLVPGGEESKNKVNESMIGIWKNVLKRTKPHIIHCFGTEYAHVLSAVFANKGIPLVVSIQGLTSVYQRYYYAGMKLHEIIFHYTWKDLIRRTGILYGKREMKRRGALERSILSHVKAVIGRTDWDRAHVKSMNKDALYYYNNEILRSGFYSAPKWRLEHVERNSIFVSQATYPIKGFHILAEALHLLRGYNVTFKVYVSGSDIYGDLNRNRLRDNGYVKYIKKKLRTYHLTESVVFLGALEEEQMIERYLKSHVFVSPSAIENSPNSVGEAMLLGVPVISSFVGGVSSILTTDEGLFYPFEEAKVLAYYLHNLLTDDELAQRLSERAVMRANASYDREKNGQELTDIYYQLKEEYDNAKKNDS